MKEGGVVKMKRMSVLLLWMFLFFFGVAFAETAPGLLAEYFSFEGVSLSSMPALEGENAGTMKR